MTFVGISQQDRLAVILSEPVDRAVVHIFSILHLLLLFLLFQYRNSYFLRHCFIRRKGECLDLRPLLVRSDLAPSYYPFPSQFATTVAVMLLMLSVLHHPVFYKHRGLLGFG